MKELSNEIKRYTSRKGNKVLFKGKITLSELALQMWEALGHQKVDSALLSKVLHGERLFTPLQLEIFCKLLKLNTYEQWHLKNALYEDYYQKYNVSADLITSPYYVDMVKLHLTRASLARQEGNPEVTLEWIDAVYAQLNNLLSNYHGTLPSHIYALQAEVLFQKIRAYRDFVLPSDSLSHIIPYINEISVLAKKSENKDISGRMYFNLGCTYHIAGKHILALKNFNFSQKALTSKNEKLELLRAKLLTLAYLHNTYDYNSTKKQLLQMIYGENSLSQELLCEALEGIARAEGIVGEKNALKTLNDAKRVNKNMKKNGKNFPSLDIQIMRTELEILKNLYLNTKKDLFIQANEVLQVALSHGYKRHSQKISQFLADLA